MGDETMRAIDAWVNVQMPRRAAGWQKQVARDLFKRAPEDVFRNTSVDEMLQTMDRLQVDRALLTIWAQAPSKHVLAFTDAHPDRFALGAYVDPRRRMKALRELEALARDQPVVNVQVIPSLIERSSADRVCYPLYAKCIELALPVSVATGIPGPPLPARFQDPIALDDVCLFFPELTIVMSNGADPWWHVAIRLMVKHANLHLMTSACAPKYLPRELIDFMNTRGRDKVLFATDHPFLTLDRCLPEAQALGLETEALDAYLYGNAERLFFKREDA